jgi:U3 small nucleolar RNA-associated protein 22
VAVPYVAPLPTQETNWKVGFVPPGKEEIVLVGSWPVGVGVKKKDAGVKGRAAFGVDLAVEMDPVSTHLLGGVRVCLRIRVDSISGERLP